MLNYGRHITSRHTLTLQDDVWLCSIWHLLVLTEIVGESLMFSSLHHISFSCKGDTCVDLIVFFFVGCCLLEGLKLLCNAWTFLFENYSRKKCCGIQCKNYLLRQSEFIFISDHDSADYEDIQMCWFTLLCFRAVTQI